MSALRQLSRHAVLLGLSLLVVAPFAWMITTSLKSADKVNTGPYLVPHQFEWGNYPQALSAAPFGHYYVNSVVMTAGIVAGHLVLDTLAAYALARLRFPGRNVVFLGLVATMLVPTFLTVLPAFDLVIRFGWFNSYTALIVPRLADVFGIVVIRGYLLSLPRELDEAARIDGANRMQVLVRVLLPLCKPALASTAVFSFLFAWNDFLWPLLVTSDDQYRTIQLGLAAFTSKYAPYPQYLMAGTVVAAVPAIVVFVYLQRSLVRGLAATGVKE
ncbi:carbohydrate ABC transporter permease [Knoellia koreensis]|uniref:Carbohydrate ABC transporter permease n=1 Tax=Knoellia koreensis TaxID=2730921 RepID=A0A849HCE7_9MICO|nr:carbohydrate ABC transporter permease [Knoellia sp. DB2414S]NNM47416.1 carbohydrate ABC transporter permease [Knoellia sp. DB2414S]